MNSVPTISQQNRFGDYTITFGSGRALRVFSCNFDGKKHWSGCMCHSTAEGLAAFIAKTVI